MKQYLTTFYNTIMCKRGITIVVLALLVSVTVPAQTIKLTSTKATMHTLIQAIEKQTNMSVDYSQNTIDLNKTVNVSSNSLSLQNLLAQMLRGTGLNYNISNRHIIITHNVNKVQQGNNTHKKEVKGRVVDASGEPLIGVSVKVKGTNNATVTDIDGNYSINANGNDVLEFSYVGFTPKEVKANSNNIDVSMSEDSKELTEVVVTALGIKREQKALSYNVQQIKGDDLSTNKDANFINSLNGKVAGVNINASS